MKVKRSFFTKQQFPLKKVKIEMPAENNEVLNYIYNLMHPSNDQSSKRIEDKSVIITSKLKQEIHDIMSLPKNSLTAFVMDRVLFDLSALKFMGCNIDPIINDVRQPILLNIPVKYLHGFRIDILEDLGADFSQKDSEGNNILHRMISDSAMPIIVITRLINQLGFNKIFEVNSEGMSVMDIIDRKIVKNQFEISFAKVDPSILYKYQNLKIVLENHYANKGATIPLKVEDFFANEALQNAGEQSSQSNNNPQLKVQSSITKKNNKALAKEREPLTYEKFIINNLMLAKASIKPPTYDVFKAPEKPCKPLVDNSKARIIADIRVKNSVENKVLKEHLDLKFKGFGTEHGFPKPYEDEKNVEEFLRSVFSNPEEETKVAGALGSVINSD